jgi:hypothetical protein
VSDVVISHCTIDCRRFDWFWWGDGDPIHFMSRRRFSELHPELEREDPPAGAIRNVLLSNIIAHGKSRCILRGHPEQWLSGIRMSDVRLFLSADPKADYNKEGSGLTFKYARDVQLHNVEVALEDPSTLKWKSPLAFEDASDVLVDGFRGGLPAGSREPAISLKNVKGAVIRNSRADPRGAILLVAGLGTEDIVVGTGVIPPANEVEREARPARILKPARKPTPAKKTAAKVKKPGAKPAKKTVVRSNGKKR